MSAANKGFSLIEVLAAVVLLGVGIAALMTGLGKITAAESRMNERERRQNLALDRLRELVATRDLDNPNQSGDFADRGLDDYRWTADITASGVENLEVVRVAVNKESENQSAAVQVSTLVFRPQTTDAGGTP